MTPEARNTDWLLWFLVATMLVSSVLRSVKISELQERLDKLEAGGVGR